MALDLSGFRDSIEVVCRLDSSIGNPDRYDEYLETLDESVLELTSQPTHFVVKTVLGWDTARAIRKKQVQVTGGVQARGPQGGKKGREATEPEITFDLTASAEEMRFALVGILNPAGVAEDKKIKWEKDKADAGTCRILWAKLSAMQVTGDLYTAREAALARQSAVTTVSETTKKN